MLFRRRALFLAGLIAAVSCSDAGNIAGPEGPEPQPIPPVDALQALVCTVQVASGQMRCQEPAPGTGAARGMYIGGLNGVNVLLTSSGHTNVNDTMTIDVTVENRLGQAIGVDSTGAVSPDGLQVFFYDGGTVVTPEPGETADFAIIAPTGMFLHAGEHYFQYAPAALPPGDTSPAVQWKFKTVNVDKFSFVVYVKADVQFPDGPEGDAARAVLPRAIAQSRDRLCTVSRTIQLGADVGFEQG